MSFFEENNDDHWIPLADIMTGLMIIFMLISVSFMLKMIHKETRLHNEVKNNTMAIKVQDRLAKQLQKDLGNNFSSWNAIFESKTLTIKFSAESVMFATGKSDLTHEFEKILQQFLPAYLASIHSYISSIAAIDIDGYASSNWGKASLESAYFYNMKLSQQRSINVLHYLHQNISNEQQLKFMRQYFTANGYSSSHIIFNNDGSENNLQSQRVEFKIILK